MNTYIECKKKGKYCELNKPCSTSSWVSQKNTSKTDFHNHSFWCCTTIEHLKYDLDTLKTLFSRFLIAKTYSLQCFLMVKRRNKFEKIGPKRTTFFWCNLAFYPTFKDAPELIICMQGSFCIPYRCFMSNRCNWIKN